MIPGIGGVLGKKLIAHFGTIDRIFREPKRSLQKISGIGENLAGAFKDPVFLAQAEKELDFIERNGIRALFYNEKDYPARLKHCPDGPLLLYFKGNADLNQAICLGVVGTRRPSEYGKSMTNKMVGAMQELDAMIVSGLAYGIDTAAHISALDHGIPTVGVLAHGLDIIYPGMNRALARRMTEKGGLVTEFPSGTSLHRDLFPKRNRIIAGMSDAVLVIESAAKGGALITADVACSYHRDVFALPGRVGDPVSTGPHLLIKQNKAALVESSADIIDAMNWHPQGPERRHAIQKKLFVTLNDDERKIADMLHETKDIHFDDLYLASGMSQGALNAVLLRLEFEGIVRALPGKMFRIV